MGPLVSRVISTPRCPFWAPDPAVSLRGSSAAGAPGPLPPRAGAAGMFSPPRGAASCPPCWKPIPVTDSGPLRSGGGRVSRFARRGGAGGSGSPPAIALPLALRGRCLPRPVAAPPPSPAELCNPVAAARPRAGPWGEGWGRETATRGAACAGPRSLASAFPAPGCGVRRRRSGRGAGLQAELGGEGGRRRRAASAAFLRAGGLRVRGIHFG